MATGRCAGEGCGYTAAALRVNAHVLTCSSYLELFRTDPGRCLTPEAEYARYKEIEDSPDARARRRDIRLRQRYAESERMAPLREDRWVIGNDILAD